MGKIAGFVRDWTQSWLNIFKDKFTSITNISQLKLRTLEKDFADTFGSIETQVSSAFQNIANSFANSFYGMADGLSGPANRFVDKLNALINAAQNAQNTIASLLSFDITLPDVVARYVGLNHAWLNIPKRYSNYRVPYLASGAVIPPNAPFMAVLGDQRRGNNIEAPEELLRKVVREEAGSRQQTNNTYQFIGKINGRTLFEEIISEAKLRRDQSGRNPFELT
jgi:hypothetical protein